MGDRGHPGYEVLWGTTAPDGVRVSWRPFLVTAADDRRLPWLETQFDRLQMRWALFVVQVGILRFCYDALTAKAAEIVMLRTAWLKQAQSS